MVTKRTVRSSSAALRTPASASFETICGRGHRTGGLRDDDVGLDGVRIEPQEPGRPEPLGQTAGVAVVVGEPLDVMAEGVERPAAMMPAWRIPPPKSCGRAGRRRRTRPSRRPPSPPATEALREAHRRGVDRRRSARPSAPGHRRVPEPGAVQVHPQAAGVGESASRPAAPAAVRGRRPRRSCSPGRAGSGAAWWTSDGSRRREAMSATSSTPPSPKSIRVCTPGEHGAPACSCTTMCASSWMKISSPGRVCERTETRLPIAPDGT